MSAFSNNSVTLKGAVAIAALVAGGTLEFTRIAVGDGNIPAGQTPLTMTDLSHRLFDVAINKVYSDSESQATVIGVFNNLQTETGFYYRELGLFAKDPVTGAEILFCYGNAGDEAEWISPAGSESVIEKEVHIVTLVGNATTVTATMKSGIYPTMEQMTAAVKAVDDKLPLKADLDKKPSEGGRVLATQMRFDADQTLYVDALATAEGADGSEAKPFKTIQAAIDARYRGTHVIYIKIKPGVYNENIKTPRAPDTTWRFSKDGDGTVVVGTALIDNAAYAYLNGIIFNGPAQSDTPIFMAANTPCVYLNSVTVNGTSNDTGINFSASRGIIVNSQVNNCGIAVASIEGSQILCQSTNGTGNTRGVYASGATVTLSNWGLSATTPYDIVNGGAVHSDSGATTYPSNEGHLYSLGGFTTAESLRTRLGQEFGKLKEGDYKAFQFWNNITGNFGTFISSQTMHVVLHKTSNDGGGYGIAHFYAHRDAGAAYMQYVNGGFTTETPIPLTKWQTISDGTTNVLDLPTGIYSMVNVGTSQNLPTTQGGTLYVDKNLGTQHLMYFVDIEPKIYSRSYYSHGEWGPWEEYTPGIASTSEYGLVRLASESDVLNETDETVMDVPLSYELNDFRRMNKAYVVGDKVNCAFRFEWFLECIQAGTTSNETLDTRNVTFGQEITDGTVKWVVRAHVKSVNNAVPDKNGNINVEIGDIKTINGNKPDSNGNITPEQTGCLPLTGNRTVTGTIYSNGNVSRPVIAYCANAGNTSSNVTEGGQLWLFNKDEITYKGGFILRTINQYGVNAGDLKGTSDGELKWIDNPVVIGKTVIGVPSYMKFRFDGGASWAFIWGNFSGANKNAVVITLPIAIYTLVTGWVNPSGNNADTHMCIRQINSTQIQIQGGTVENDLRSGNWGIIAHVVF